MPYEEAPHYSGRIQVSQSSEDTSDSVGIAVSILAAAPFFAVAVWCMDNEFTGWRAAAAVGGAIFLMLLACVAMVFGLGAWITLQAARRRRRGQPEPFDRTTMVAIGPHGVSMEGLGHVDWPDVLSFEGIPDSESHLIVHTRPFGPVMLGGPCDMLVPIVQHYLEHPGVSGAVVPPVRAVVFSWPWFRSWIWAGYALAAAMVVAMLLANPDAGALKTMSALFLVPVMTAWLVWSIPFGRLSTFSARRVSAFVLNDTVLRDTCGRWTIDLRRQPAQYRQASGIGYRVAFLTLRPLDGARIDLVLEASPEHNALLDALDERGLLIGRGPRPVID